MEEKTPEYLVNRCMPHEFDRSKRESETLSHGGGWVRGVLYRGGMLQRGGVLYAVAYNRVYITAVVPYSVAQV